MGIVWGPAIPWPENNLWFTDYSNGRIGRLSPLGDVDEFQIPTPNGSPWSITVGPDQNLWFTEIDGNKVGKMFICGSDAGE